MARRTSKIRKLRGSRTHGRGAGKRNRGKGSRGGYGWGGVGKRGSHKMTRALTELGRKSIGYTGMRLARRQLNTEVINLGQIEERLDSWIKAGTAKKEGDAYVIDLTALGYDKLLGTGELKHKLKINVSQMSESAKSKLGVERAN